MTTPLTWREIRRAVLDAAKTGEAASTHQIHDRCCRRDAVGRISTHDSEYFDEVLSQMVADGEIVLRGPFVSAPYRRPA